MATIYSLVCSSSFNLAVPFPGAYVSPIKLHVSSGLGLQPSVQVQALRSWVLHVTANLGIAPSTSVQAITTHVLRVTANVGFKPGVSAQALRTYSVHVTAGLALQPSLSGFARTTIRTLAVTSGVGLQASVSKLTYNAVHQVSVSAGLGVAPKIRLNIVKGLTVVAGLGIHAAVSDTATRVFHVQSTLGLQPSVFAPRTIVLSVSSGLGLQATTVPVDSFYVFSVSSGLGIRSFVTVQTGGLNVHAQLNFQAMVSCEALIDSGVGIPGLSPIGGPQTPLLDGISGSAPFTFAETPSGIVLMANGIDPMLRWNSCSGAIDRAGVVPPLTGPTVTTTGPGLLTGIRFVLVRFISSYGQPSIPGPVTGPINCGYDQLIDDIVIDPSGNVTIEADGHGLATNQQVIFQGVGGLPLNGVVAVTVVDADHFTLKNQVVSGNWTGGGSFSVGVSAITYSNLPVPLESKVARVQILRNLDGNADVFYVDVDVPVPPSGPFTSTLTDEQLATGQAIVIRSDDGWPLALRDSLPPSSRPFLIPYMGRIFAAGDAIYDAGCATVQAGSNLVQGIATQWPSNFAGRTIYIKGSSQPYGISSVSGTNQTMVLAAPYTGPSNLFAAYLIRSAPAERKMLAWSEPDRPESWPPWNAVGIPENNDEITGLFVKGTYLYILERRHIWRYQFQDDPASGSHVFLAIESRGAINHRVVVQADDLVYLLDESGIYSYDGGNSTDPISDLIQVVFQSDGLTYTQQIDWSADTTLWHASLDPVRTIIRWFVTMQGQPALTTAICYNYRQKRWWLEAYPIAITSSATGTLTESPHAGIRSGYRRAIVGAEARMVLVLGEGALDLVVDSGTLRGTVAQATSVSITDPAATFAPSLGGGTISIVSGTGAGQQRVIAAVRGDKIFVVQRWTTIPDDTSVYQIGGIAWEWRSGWLDVEEEETDTVRDYVLSYQPLTASTQISTQFFYDHSELPEIWAFARSLDGVYVLPGQPDVWMDLTANDVLPGWRVWRQAAHTERYGYEDRFVQILLSGVQNDQTVRVYQVSIRGVDQEGL